MEELFYNPSPPLSNEEWEKFKPEFPELFANVENSPSLIETPLNVPTPTTPAASSAASSTPAGSPPEVKFTAANSIGQFSKVDHAAAVMDLIKLHNEFRSSWNLNLGPIIHRKLELDNILEDLSANSIKDFGFSRSFIEQHSFNITVPKVPGATIHVVYYHEGWITNYLCMHVSMPLEDAKNFAANFIQKLRTQTKYVPNKSWVPMRIYAGMLELVQTRVKRARGSNFRFVDEVDGTTSIGKFLSDLDAVNQRWQHFLTNGLNELQSILRQMVLGPWELYQQHTAAHPELLAILGF